MLHISYYAMFKGAPTILIGGSEREIRALRCVLAEWRGQSLSIFASLRPHVSLLVDELVDFVLEVARDRATQSRAALEHGKVVWSLSVLEQDRIIGLLDGLCVSRKAGHQYLDNGAGSIQVLCSKGEYPSNLSSGPDGQ
jgi:hypothetical protein